METQAIYQVAVRSEPYTRKAFTGTLKARGINKNSHSWTDYELGKAIIQSLEDGDPGQAQYYNLYLSYLTSWISV